MWGCVFIHMFPCTIPLCASTSMCVAWVWLAPHIIHAPQGQISCLVELCWIDTAPDGLCIMCVCVCVCVVGVCRFWVKSDNCPQAKKLLLCALCCKIRLLFHCSQFKEMEHDTKLNSFYVIAWSYSAKNIVNHYQEIAFKTPFIGTPEDWESSRKTPCCTELATVTVIQSIYSWMWPDQPWSSTAPSLLPFFCFSVYSVVVALSSGVIWSRVKDWSWWGMAACGTGINSRQVVLVWFPVHRPGCDLKVAGSKLERFEWWGGCWMLGQAEELTLVTVGHKKLNLWRVNKKPLFWNIPHNFLSTFFSWQLTTHI